MCDKMDMEGEHGVAPPMPSFFFPSASHETGNNEGYMPVPQIIDVVVVSGGGPPEQVVIDYDRESQLPPCVCVEEKSKRWISPVVTFFFWYVIISSTVGVVAALSFAYVNDDWSSYSPTDWLSLMICFAPLIGLEVTLGIPSLWNLFKTCFVTDSWRSLVPWASLIASAWVGSSVLYERFNPLSFGFVFATSIAVLGSLQFVGRALRRDSESGNGLTFVDVALWCLLFVPLDYRWYDIFYWFGPKDMSYDWWALAITLLGIMGWGLYRDLPGFGYRLVPNVKDVLTALAATGGLAIIVIPLGLGSGFLQWPPTQVPTFWQVFSVWFENVLTVAITEELFFRVVIMNGVNLTVKDNKNGWVGLLVSSFCFGLMHWPRRNGQPIQQLIYASLAFVSGILYGQAYRLSGNNILAAVLTHSWTDTCWAFLFS